MSVETKAGLVTVLGIVALLAAIVFLRGGISFRDRGYHLHVRVANAAGVTIGAPVLMAGVEVGRVRRLGLTPERRAEVTIRLHEGITIPTGSRFAIATSGLLGDRFITISPGPSTAPPIEPETVVVGVDPFTVDQLFDRVVAVARRAEETLASINRLISDPTLGAGLSEAVRNARDATAVMRRAAENIERTTRALDRSVGTDVPVIAAQIRSMATDLADAAREIRTLVGDVAADGQTSRQVRETIGAVQRAAQRIDMMTQALSGVLNEQQVRALRASLAEAQSAITEARQGVAEIRQGATEIRQGVAEARGVVGRADRVIERVGRLLPERLELPGIRGSYRLEYELWYTGARLGHDLSFTMLPDAPRSYIFTVRDVGGASRVGLQIGNRLANTPLTFRYGLIDSQLGVGLDYRASPSSIYTIDLSNINQITLNVYAHYLLDRDYGISLRAQNLLYQPILGIGYFRRF